MKSYPIGYLAAIITLILHLVGCSYDPRQLPEPQTYPVETTPAVQTFIVGQSARQRPIECIELGQGQNVILLLAAIHGNEKAGTPLLRKLAEYLLRNRPLLQQHKVIIIPIANPDGVARNTRYNASGIDLNRNFTAANRHNGGRYGHAPLSEPESRILDRLISRYNPQRIVSIHQPLACIDYDGPAEDLARAMAQQCDLPVRKLGARPGSLGAFAGESLGIPTITLELARSDDQLDPDALWARYGSAVLVSVNAPLNAK